MKKKNYAAIDVAKYVSALLVVCIHTYPLYDLSPAANTFLIQAICRFAVPSGRCRGPYHLNTLLNARGRNGSKR